ncbi:MAG: PBECR2 nuclease fold domain-containing protein [Thermodesulfobacteriota bacterium]
MASELINLEVKGRPMAAAVDYLKAKIDLPTEHWYDLAGGMHSRAFVVAGATKSGLLADFHGAINQAISGGMTLEQFRKDFDLTVAKHGWSFRGGRNWRTTVIYNTNIQVAYQAGRYKELQGLAAAAPYWEYRSKRDSRVREQHRQWDGLILRADHQWWNSHYPPNGWGCRCRVWPRTAGDLRRAGRLGQDQAPEDGTYQWVDPKTGEVKQVPKGVDPGWDYHPGKAAWGRKLSEESMGAWQAGRDKWQRLTPGNWQTYDRPEMIPADLPKAALGERAVTREELRDRIAATIGGAEKVFRFQNGDFSYPVLVNAETLAGHMDLDRSAFVPLLPELLADPFEVWLAFEQHSASGQVVLRQRLIKAVQLEKDKGLLLVVQSANGMMEGWTFFPVSNLKYLNNQRQGKLVYRREN